MSALGWTLCQLLLVPVVLIGFANATNSCSRQIVVDQSGHGHFHTIQAAIDSVPVNNSRWVCINVRAGIYREKVDIDVEKEYIYLKGQGRKTTSIVWSDHYSVVQSATFTAWANNFCARSISFVNAYNLPAIKKTNPRAPAVAAMVVGNNSAFYRCGFFGVQDTLWDFQGRHYYKSCTIVGAVDFIFGSGQTIFEGSTIGTNAAALEPGVPGVITAQGRSSPNEDNGFVFKDCNVIGQGQTHLGRPWRPYARVIFYRTYMSANVVSAGWDAWVAANHEDQLTFAEVGCNGMGANQTGRVPWMAKLSDSELQRLTSRSYIDTDGWISRLPLRI